MMNFKTASLLLLVLSAVSFGCKKAEVPLLLEPLEAQKIGYSPALWVNTIDIQSSQSLSQAVIYNNVLYTIEAPANMVTAVSLLDGSIMWNRALAQTSDILFKPNIHNNKLLINSETHIYTLSAATGNLIEKSPLQQVVSTSPTIIGELAIFGTNSGRIYAHNLNSGFARWEFAMEQRVSVAPVLFGNTSMVVDDYGMWALISSDYGNRIWSGRAFGRISVAPVIGNQLIYIASEDNSLYAIDKRSGYDRWKYQDIQSLTVQPMLIDDLLILPLARGGMLALDAQTGDIQWKLEGQGKVLGKQGKNILMYNRDGMFLVDDVKGKIVNKVTAGPLDTVLKGPGNSLILISPTGRIMRVDPAIAM